jgi:P-type Ca2+ transporter type 2C
MVLKDDSFSSIVVAVMQGRVIYDNIRKFVVYLLSCNMSELFVVSVSSVLNLHFQLFPLQILFINLVTDVLPALALGVTRGDEYIMQQPPRNIKDPILDRARWISLTTYAIVITVTTISAVFFSHLTVHRTEAWNTELCNNILFYTLIFSQLLLVFNVSSDNKSAFWKTEVFRSRYVWSALGICLLSAIFSYIVIPVRNILSILEMTWEDWMIAACFGILSFFLIRILKKLKLVL